MALARLAELQAEPCESEERENEDNERGSKAGVDSVPEHKILPVLAVIGAYRYPAEVTSCTAQRSCYVLDATGRTEMGKSRYDKPIIPWAKIEREKPDPSDAVGVMIEKAWQAFEAVEHFPDVPEGGIGLITLRNLVPDLLRTMKQLNDEKKKAAGAG